MFEKIKAFDEYEIVSPVVEELETLWNELGGPYPPEGPSTEVRDVQTLADIESMGDGATEDDVSAYNELIVELFRLIDIRYIGSGIWYTQYEQGSDAWREYTERGREIIDTFIAYDLWDRFCSMHDWSEQD
jgi:hypothetical protein